MTPFILYITKFNLLFFFKFDIVDPQGRLNKKC